MTPALPESALPRGGAPPVRRRWTPGGAEKTMPGCTSTRRRFLASMTLSPLLATVVACAPSMTAPSTTAPPAATAVVPGAKVPLNIAVRSDAQFTWQADAARQFGQEHPNVALSITSVAYNDMAKKQLAMLATGTMPDVVFSGAKWFSYSAFKGAFLAIDDLIKQGGTT